MTQEDAGRERKRRALLDTTVQLDRLKMKSRRDTLDALLADYQFKFATSLSMVEFKATLIQECITIHNQLRLKGARFTRVRDILLEKNHPQVKLRAHIFNNYINVFAGSSFTITPEADERLARDARLLLENQIPLLYKWFGSPGTIDSVLKEKLQCDRATEAPVKKTAAYSPNLPECRRGINKSCRVEELIRSEGVALIKELQPYLGDSEQLERAILVFRSVLEDPKRELSVGDCRRAGDCLIAMEATAPSGPNYGGKGAPYATHALSSNAREWAPISEAVGFDFVHITYPDEKTR